MITKIKIQSSTLAKLKLMADRNGLEPGACIEALLEFATSGHWLNDDPAFRDRFTELLETSIERVKGGGWGSCHPLVKVQDNGKVDLQELEKRIRDYEQAGES